MLPVLRRLTVRLLVVLASVTVGLLASEVMLRGFYNPPSPYQDCAGLICLDPDFGMYLCPSYRCDDIGPAVLSNAPGEYPFVLNSLGLRDKEPVVPKPANEYRVMFLGDSYVVGGAVHESETLPNQFKALAMGAPSLASRSLDVVNAGTSGFCTHQELKWYEKVGHTLDPDLVFLVFNFNDVTGYKERMTGRVKNGFQLPDGVESITKWHGFVFVAPFKADAFFTTNSYLYQFYRFRVRPALGLDPQLKQPEPIGSKDLWAYQGRGTFVTPLRGIRSDLDELASLLRATGKRLALILLPHESTVRDDDVDGVFFPDLREFARELGIGVVDPLPELRRARQQGVKVYGSLQDGDLHAHANGLAIMARLSAEWLAANPPR